MAKAYYNQASQQLNGSHNKKVQSLQNQLAQQQLSLENQKGGINSSYDMQVGKQALSNKINKNNLSNASLGRGLGNSSIAVSGLAEADQISGRVTNEINSARTGDLNNIEAQKQQLASSTAGTIGSMEADKEDAIWTLARQLEDRQWDKDYKNTQMDFSREQERANNAYRQQQLGIQREQNSISQRNSDREFALKQQQYADAKATEKQDPREKLADVRTLLSSTEVDNETKIRDLGYFKQLYQGQPGTEYVIKEIDYNIAKLSKASLTSSLNPTQKKLDWFLDK